MPLSERAREAWATGHAGMGWEEMTRRTCRRHGGFEPDIRHRTSDATVAPALVARGVAVTLLPALPLPDRKPGIALRALADAPVQQGDRRRDTRGRRRPRRSTQALLSAVRDAAAALPAA